MAAHLLAQAEAQEEDPAVRALLETISAAKERYFPECPNDEEYKTQDSEYDHSRDPIAHSVAAEISGIIKDTLVMLIAKCAGPDAVAKFLDLRNVARFEFVRQGTDTYCNQTILRCGKDLVFGHFKKLRGIETIEWDPIVAYKINSGFVLEFSNFLQLGAQETKHGGLWGYRNAPLNPGRQPYGNELDWRLKLINPESLRLEGRGAAEMSLALMRVFMDSRSWVTRENRKTWFAASPSIDGNAWEGERSGF
ncbi:MAG: hypothetical protein M1820_006180 [Bogoriella megaspora]|nr:MAG: hypothetical protein M1820_006180 [Bogoriella megaspora]